MTTEVILRKPTQPLTVDTPLTECPTNLDLTNPAEKAMAFAAGNPGDYQFDENGEVTISAIRWLVFADSSVDPENGEISEFGRLVLFDKDGRFFRSSSAFGPKRLKAAVELYTNDDWDRGITFLIRQRRGKTQRTYHDIRVIA